MENEKIVISKADFEKVFPVYRDCGRKMNEAWQLLMDAEKERTNADDSTPEAVTIKTVGAGHQAVEICQKCLSQLAIMLEVHERERESA